MLQQLQLKSIKKTALAVVVPISTASANLKIGGKGRRKELKNVIDILVVVGLVISTRYIRDFVSDCLKIAKEIKECPNDDKFEKVGEKNGN